MNVANNINGLSYDPRHSRRRRPISVLQLAMTMAFIGLPATVLFPIIAQPVAEKGQQAVLSQSAAFEQRIKSTTFYEMSLRRHMHDNALSAWRVFEKYSITHRVHQTH